MDNSSGEICFYKISCYNPLFIQTKRSSAIVGKWTRYLGKMDNICKISHAHYFL